MVDSAIASEVAWAMLHDAVNHQPPSIGTNSELQMILRHRRSLRSGFGLPVRPQDCPGEPVPVGQPPIACGEDLCGLSEMKPSVDPLDKPNLTPEERAKMQ